MQHFQTSGPGHPPFLVWSVALASMENTLLFGSAFSPVYGCSGDMSLTGFSVLVYFIWGFQFSFGSWSFS